MLNHVAVHTAPVQVFCRTSLQCLQSLITFFSFFWYFCGCGWGEGNGKLAQAFLTSGAISGRGIHRKPSGSCCKMVVQLVPDIWLVCSATHNEQDDDVCCQGSIVGCIKQRPHVLTTIHAVFQAFMIDCWQDLTSEKKKAHCMHD
jgi:hypothetical protein